MRIAVLIDSMAYMGGAQKVTSRQVNYWSQHGHAVHLFTYTDPVASESFFALQQSIQLKNLFWEGIPKSPIPKTTLVKRLLKVRKEILSVRPEVVLGVTEAGAVLALQALIGSRIPIVVFEHIDPSQQVLPAKVENLRQKLYPQARAVVCLTQRALESFPDRIRRKGYVIPNAVPEPEWAKVDTRTFQKDEYVAIYVGRLLNAQKRVDRAIIAFDRISASHPNWTFEIWGAGEDENELRNLVRNLSNGKKIKFMGATVDPVSVMKRSDLLLLTSQFEGMPLVIGEAMSVGLPVISFDCPTGPREMIRDSVDGVLVPNGDVDAFARELDRLMSNHPERLEMGMRACSIVERYSEPSVMQKWDDLLLALPRGSR